MEQSDMPKCLEDWIRQQMQALGDGRYIKSRMKMIQEMQSRYRFRNVDDIRSRDVHEVCRLLEEIGDPRAIIRVYRGLNIVFQLAGRPERVTRQDITTANIMHPCKKERDWMAETPGSIEWYVDFRKSFHAFIFPKFNLKSAIDYFHGGCAIARKSRSDVRGLTIEEISQHRINH